jgi:uridine kinase
MLEDLIKQIEDHLIQQQHLVVAISGFAGSGKSSLASKLQENFNLSDGQILHIDHLYAPKPRGKGLFDDYDWLLLKTILANVHDGKRLKYQSIGYEGDSYIIDEKLPRVVILEGIQLFRSEMMEQFDISVWVNCPIELALERAKARDKGQNQDEQYMKLWDSLWGPRNEEYYNEYHPEKLANFLYEGYK